jgi:hypothetical protein
VGTQHQRRRRECLPQTGCANIDTNSNSNFKINTNTNINGGGRGRPPHTGLLNLYKDFIPLMLISSDPGLQLP